MAKQSGKVFIGSINGITGYYNRYDGYLMRETGGITSKQFLTGKQFDGARRNSREFGEASDASALFRKLLAPFLDQLEDRRYVRRLQSLFIRLKKLDEGNEWGERHAFNGLLRSEGLALLHGFEFGRTKLRDVVRCPVEVDHSTCTVLLKNYDPLQSVAFPQEASHAALTCCAVKLDADAKSGQLFVSPTQLLSRESASGTLSFSVDCDTTEGIVIYYLQVVYFESCKDGLRMLRDRRWNILSPAIVVPGHFGSGELGK